MSRKEMLAEYNRIQIVNAANALFEAKGYDLTTVDEIAKEAGCSKSTVYMYFEGKESIYDHIVLESMILIKEALERVIKEDIPFDAMFMNICMTLSSLEQEKPVYFKSALQYISVDEQDISTNPTLKDIYEVGEEINKILICAYEKRREEPISASDPSSIVLTFHLWGCISGLINLASEKEKYIKKSTGMSREEFLRQGFELLLHAVSK